MSAPVTFFSIAPLQTRSPRLSVGGFAISLRFRLGRASTRLTKANKAQETKKEAYEDARRLVYVFEDVRPCRPGVVVADAQFPGPGVESLARTLQAGGR